MINKSIGYVISESDLTSKISKITESSSNGKAVADCILQTADEKNRNGRYYAESELFPQITAPRTVELLNAGYLRAEMGHPLSKDLQRQATIDDTKTCARFLKLWTEGKNVWGRVTGTNNQYGNAFDLDLKEGCIPAWSLRALGSVTQTPRGMEVRNLRLITWDQVIYPSHPGAYMQKLVSEQSIISEAVGADTEPANDYTGKTGGVFAITNESVLNFIQASSDNVKFVRECMDFVYETVEVSENGSKVVMKSNVGDVYVVNLEAYVHNELMDYASRMMEYRQ